MIINLKYIHSIEEAPVQLEVFQLKKYPDVLVCPDILIDQVQEKCCQNTLMKNLFLVIPLRIVKIVFMIIIVL